MEHASEVFGLEMIEQAHERIRGHIRITPLLRLEQLDETLGCKVYAKVEAMQATGSFKLRGALNAILSMGEDELSRGIVTASSGNHGRACAYAAKRLGIAAVVVLPDGAPASKVAGVRDLGAEVVRCPAAERFDVARSICEKRGAVYVPPYDDYRVMAGQGTLGLEICEQLPDVDMVVTPLSGGGLLSGGACAVKSVLPRAAVVGAEPAVLARYAASLEVGRPVQVEQRSTIADALVSNHPGKLCFPIVREHVDAVVSASEKTIQDAWRLVIEQGKLFVEASACLGVAAVLEGTINVRADERVCFVLSGGNCSISQLA